MSRGRRAVLLAGMSLALGGIAASDMRRREAALEHRIGPTAPVLVARAALPAGALLTRGRLAVRQVPARWTPAGAFSDPTEALGLRLTVGVAAGADLGPGVVDDGQSGVGAPVRPGERVAEVIAVGSPSMVRPGVKVDVLVTRADEAGSGRTTLALEDVDVLSARAASEARSDDGAPRVAVSLRVTVRQAVYLAAAQSFAREVRVLPRAAGDRGRTGSAVSVGAGL